ncbi:N-formyl peptide receptor 3-like [Physella acuta]|uniref:N-formyl peptide receptor 3-like n=1 Tax=Physella acuta TaxID=109671 RepID=UPI0027DD7E63|nr:N-formyl peptide receptor 3-like [Physella acuta]
MDVLTEIKQTQDTLNVLGFKPTVNFSEEPSEDLQIGTPFVNCYPVVIAFYVFCSFGVFGNCVTVFIVCRHGLNTTTNILLCSLSVSDLTFSICNIVEYYNMKYSETLNMETILKSKSSRYILHLIYDLSLSFSYHIVALISIERLLAVSLPFSVSKFSTPHRIKCVIILLFLYVAAVGSSENNITYYYQNKIFTNNDMTMSGLTGIVRTRIVFIVYRLTFVSTVPLTTVFLCTSLTIIKLVMTSRKMKNLNNNKRMSKTIKNMRVIKMLVMLQLGDISSSYALRVSP